MRKIFLLVFLCSLFSVRISAQFSATLTGYPLVTTGWTYGGTSTVVDSEMRLTSPTTSQGGYVYYSTPVNLTSCGQFTVDFEFKILASAGTTVADGIAFWYISNPPSGFITGGGIGLPSYPNGLLMIMDTYDNDGNGNNPLETLLGYTGTTLGYTEGSGTGLLGSVVPNQYFIDDGTWHHCKITYNTGNIAVYFNYSATASITAYYPLTITGYFGFSSSTGAAYSTQLVKNVHITAAGTSAPPTVTSPVYYCQGATASALTATGTGTIRWFSTDTATVTSLSGAPVPNTSTVGTTYYYVRQGSGSCIRAPDSIEVIVSAVPAAPVITGDTAYCQGTSFIPFTVTGAGILWYTSGTGGTGSTTATTISTAVPGVYTVYASQTNVGCEGSRDSLTVTVHATPAAPTLTGGDTIYCQYQPFAALTVTGTNVLWYTSATGGTGSVTAPVVNTSIPGTYNFYVTQTVNGCESPRLHIPVVVNAKPSAPVVAPYHTCQLSAPMTLTATGTGIMWYGPGITAGYTTAPTPATTVAVSDTYYVTQTVAGCTSDSATDIIVIIAKPNPPVTHDTAVCQYTTAPVLTAIGSNLLWYTTLTGGSAITGAPMPNTTIPGNTLWYVSQTVNGCESDRAMLNVIIAPIPVFHIAVDSPYVCQYDTLNLSYSGTGFITSYSWMLPTGDTFAYGTNSTQASVIVEFGHISSNDLIYLTATSAGASCSSTDTIHINVNPQPTAEPYTKQDVCFGDTVSLALVNQSSNASSFTWFIDNQPLSTTTSLIVEAHSTSSGGPYKIFWNATGVHVIELFSYSDLGCKSLPVLDTVNVHHIPDATFTYGNNRGNLCINDSVLFRANDSSYSHYYQWTPDHFFSIANQPDIWGRLEDAKSIITLTVTDAFGCTASSQQELDPGTCCIISFPSAFTPNGDGNNDLFRPIFAGFHRFHEFRVENRWGQTVFQSNSNMVEWDGTLGGTPQDMGVYFYYIKYDCGGSTLEQRGDVTLIR